MIRRVEKALMDEVLKESEMIEMLYTSTGIQLGETNQKIHAQTWHTMRRCLCMYTTFVSVSAKTTVTVPSIAPVTAFHAKSFRIIPWR
jgi:hypothetical protein